MSPHSSVKESLMHLFPSQNAVQMTSLAGQDITCGKEAVNRYPLGTPWEYTSWPLAMSLSWHVESDLTGLYMGPVFVFTPHRCWVRAEKLTYAQQKFSYCLRVRVWASTKDFKASSRCQCSILIGWKNIAEVFWVTVSITEEWCTFGIPNVHGHIIKGDRSCSQ